MKPKWIVVFLVLTLSSAIAEAQELDTAGVENTKLVAKDTIVSTPSRSPKKAALLSALIPGAGQIYNRKYWKLPLVYAGFGVSLGFAINNHNQHNLFKAYYLSAIDGDPGTTNVYTEQGVTADQLRAAADQYLTWKEYSLIALGAVYVLQIVDATVDAHLFYFDVSDDLSLQWQPQIQSSITATPNLGLGLNFTF